MFRTQTQLLCSLLIITSALSQTDKKSNPNSPVFKSYRPPTTSKPLEQSDATYQMWEGFRVQREANAGDPVSQFELSIRYLTGRGFKADTNKAALWTKKAAAQNHLLARYNLGIFQFNGWGTEWNPFESYNNFLFAAERNMPDAQYVLAQFLTENLVVPRNVNEAYRWVKLAADSGFAPARETLKEFERRGYHGSEDSLQATRSSDAQKNSSSSGAIQLMFLNFSPDTVRAASDSVLFDDAIKAAMLSQNQEVQQVFSSTTITTEHFEMDSVAFNALRATAEAGSPEALTLLARCYERGVRVQQDVVLAAMCYIRAIRFDSPRAGRLLYNLVQDRAFFNTLRHLVNHNDADAMYVWSCLIALGFDRQLTDTQALQMLERAAAKNQPQSIVELGLCYYSGRWVKRDDRRAEELWRRASALGNNEANVRFAILKIRGRKKDVAAAVTLVRDAAAKGSVLAEFAVAYCYEVGLGVGVNKAEASRLYRSCGQRGSQDAFRALERMHDEIRPKEKRFRLTE